jgi:ATP-binding cassette subfamily B protein
VSQAPGGPLADPDRRRDSPAEPASRRPQIGGDDPPANHTAPTDPSARAGPLADPDLRRALAYVLPYWRRLALVMGLSLLSTALSLYLPYLSKELVDDALLGRDFTALVRIVALFAAVTLAGFAMNVASGLRYTRVSAEILFDMRLDLYRHLQKLSPRFYARTRLGEIVSRINNDIGEIQRIAAETALAWVGNILFLAGTVGVMIWLDARLFLASVAVMPLSLWALVHYRRRLEARVKTLRERSADIGSFLIETLQGMKLVVSSNAQERETARFRAKNDAFIEALMSMQWLGYLSGGLPGLLLSAGTAIVFLYGGSRVISGAISVGTLVAFMAYQMRLLSPVQGLMGLYTNLAAARVSLRRVHEILDATVEVAEDPAASSINAPRGEVRFDDVTYSFDRGGPVLAGVSFRVRPGEIVAVVGPSGSGKSTIVDLLLRHLDPQAGTVSLDDRDLRELKLADLRRHVVAVEQEPFVFHASIAENIRYARPGAGDDEVRAAASAAGLEEFIGGLPDGFDTVVGERGTAVSAGERQRIAIARAFLADPAVLVLDEATASLDPAAERRVIDSYEAIMRGRTTLLISHRYEMARRAGRVIVIEGARIVEEGEPGRLIEAGGPFASLFAAESRQATRPGAVAEPRR